MNLKKMSTKYLLHLLEVTRHFGGWYNDSYPCASTDENTVSVDELREELKIRPHRPRKEERRKIINQMHGRA